MDVRQSDMEGVAVLHVLRLHVITTIVLCYLLWTRRRRVRRVGTNNGVRRYSLRGRIPAQVQHLNELINASDVDCFDNLRMNRNAFGRLCILLEQLGGLRNRRGVSITEQVAIFLSIISHHKKNRIVRYDFKRSGRTVSKDFNNVLRAILSIHNVLVISPEPVPDDCTDERWKWFKGCLGALDGTHIPVCVPDRDKGRYRSRKTEISVNVLAVCDRNMNFVYVLTGWEGSAADGRVLHDAMIRPNGFKVPRGNYYLCDSAYTNGEGFLAPYRGIRYHLKEWGVGMQRPQNPKELFNLRHSKARNVIEHTFGILKERWAILRVQSFYPIATQNRIIIACCLLHNFIRREMPNDPIELGLPEENDDSDDEGIEYVDHIQPSQIWTDWRDAHANLMYNEWRGHR